MALPAAGYCDRCHYLVPLDRHGRLERHDDRAKTAETLLLGARCTGSLRRPPAEPPTEVASLAFQDDPPTGRCRECGDEVTLCAPGPDGLSGKLRAHIRPDSRFGELCRGSYKWPAP